MKQDSKDKKKKLAGLKMPAKKELDVSELEKDEGSPEEEAAESPSEEASEDSSGLEGSEEDMGMDIDGDQEAGESADHKQMADLESCSDEDLLSEIKKRGLLSKLQPGEMDKQMGNEMPSAPHQVSDEEGGY